MTVADYIIRFLAARSVTHVFELSGGMITPLLDAVARNGSPTLVSCHHEQAAGFAAEGWARMTSVPGVAFATSGPGATNLLTSIASCYFDSTPAVFITGQVRRDEMKSAHQRQRGFQETDIVSMAKPVTKWTWQIRGAREVVEALQGAFFLAQDERPGPVLLDIPFDVLRAEIDAVIPPPITVTRGRATKGETEGVIAMLRSAQRPLVLVGGGCQRSRHDVAALINHLWIPTVHSLMAKDILTSDHPCNVGFIGSYGNRWANMALAKCDALLVLGSRLDVRQTGADVKSFVAGKRIVQVDVDETEVGARVPVERGIRADVGAFCQALIDPAKSPVNGAGIECVGWFQQIAEWRSKWPAECEQAVSRVNPNEFMAELGRAAIEADVGTYVVDVGQHQMWAAQSLRPGRGQRFITSGGHGAMGFALPAAIGAHYATVKPVVAIMGDGGFQINSGALHTIQRYDLPIKIVVMNNDGHGMVRQFQNEVFGGRAVSTNDRIRSMKIAEAYDIDSHVYTPLGATLDQSIDWLFKSTNPRLLEVMIDPLANALPKLAFGRTLDDMTPKK